MPENELAYHVGATTYTNFALQKIGPYPNNLLVGIECCTASDKDYIPIPSDYSNLNKYSDLGKPSKILYENLIEFAADFCTRHNLDPLTQIYRHYDITGKICHRYYVAHDNEWKQLKQDVYNKMHSISNDAEVVEATHAEGNYDWAQSCLDSLMSKGIITTPDAWTDFSAYVTKKNVIAIIDSATGGLSLNAPHACIIDHWCTKCLNSLYAKGIVTDISAWSDFNTMIKKSYLEAIMDKATGGQKITSFPSRVDHWANNCLNSLYSKGIITDVKSWNDFNNKSTTALFLALCDKAFK